MKKIKKSTKKRYSIEGSGFSPFHRRQYNMNNEETKELLLPHPGGLLLNPSRANISKKFHGTRKTYGGARAGRRFSDTSKRPASRRYAHRRGITFFDTPVVGIGPSLFKNSKADEKK